MHVEHVWVGKDVKLSVIQDENKKVKDIVATEYFNPVHWEAICQAIACNIPKKEDMSATDTAMVALVTRGAGDNKIAEL